MGCLVNLQSSLPGGLQEYAFAYRDDLFSNAVPGDKTCRSLAQLAFRSSYPAVLTYS